MRPRQALLEAHQGRAAVTHIAPGSLIDHDKEKAHKSLVKAAKCTDEA